MEIKIGKYRIRITKYWYGLYRCQVIHAFSLGFVHFIKIKKNKEG